MRKRKINQTFWAVLWLATVVTAFSQPCPITWGPTLQISNTPTSAFVPKLAVVGDTVHVIYHARALYYRRSTDAGEIWSNQFVVVPAESLPGQIFNRPFAASGSNLYVVWGNNSPSGAITSVKIRRSTDAGASWLEPQVLARSEFPYYYDKPHVAAIGQKVFVAMVRPTGQGALFLSRSFDGGATWDSLRLISGWASINDLSVSTQGLHLTSAPGSQVAYAMSTDDGETWSSRQILSTIDNYYRWEPNVAADDSGSVYVCWQDAKYGSTGYGGTLLMRKSSDNGVSWGQEVRINMIPSAVHSELALSTTGPHIAWDDERYGTFNRRIYYSMSTDGGTAWCNEVQVSDTTGISVVPAIAAKRNDVYCMWSDNSISPTPILYRKGRLTINGVINNPGYPRFSDVVLQQNYPNPFNGQTTIIYHIQSYTKIHLAIYDIVGREVTVLKDEQSQPGRYIVQFNADGFSTGVYFLVLQAGDRKEVKSILLMK